MRPDYCRRLHDRVLAETADGCAGPIWSPPVGCKIKGPPLRPITEIDRMLWGANMSERALSMCAG